MRMAASLQAWLTPLLAILNSDQGPNITPLPTYDPLIALHRHTINLNRKKTLNQRIKSANISQHIYMLCVSRY
jgi:hypothetical protein